MKTGVIISRDPVLITISERVLAGYCRIVPFGTIQSGLDYIYSIIPDLLIVDYVPEDSETAAILKTLKNDPIFTHLPILAVIEEGMNLPDIDSLFIEDFIWKAHINRDLALRAKLCIRRSERMVEINPLTRLPGNISINRTIQELIDSERIFGIAYADLDNFKPFNDHYGFTRGDEVIKMTGRLILNVVKTKQPKESFVGHIGGDDFIFIMDADLIEDAASELVTSFDKIISTFYDEKDREAGCIMSADRQGNPRSFPLLSLSIGITSNTNKVFSHYGEMTEAVSEMKRYAKHYKGSCYRIDKRQAPEGPFKE